MPTNNPIVAFLHCKQCTPEDHGELEVGLTQDSMLEVQCTEHGPVGSFELAHPIDMSKIHCDACGAPFDGREHKH
jgi:hypothetical protein